MFDERELLERMVRDDRTWPGESFCVKRRPQPGEKPVGVMGYAEFGAIFKTGTPIEIYLRSPADPRQDFLRSKKYDSVDVMMADGWVVD